ncbi:hypothetical protein [uncultured Sphaerochaeta sp.]|uniref:DUF7336 domain-containing protein n=1 Tax=uncultured Sphaerochaeta sp. TaxID=886478 RepID=UPI0029CAA70C|nr:hypothetical protein [uncultured Sphaerochaeta sp.]
MSKKVFIVTSGDYSNYHIDAVFSNEEDARKYCKIKNVTMPYPCFEVEHYNMDEIQVAHSKCMQATYKLYEVPNETCRISFDEIGFYHEPFIQFGNEFVCTVNFHMDKNVMERAVYDQYAQFMAHREGL